MVARAPKHIDILLPFHEGYSIDTAGAIGLFVYEMMPTAPKEGDPILHVFGRPPAEKPLSSHYTALTPRFTKLQGRNRSLMRAYRIAARARDDAPDMIELHNRPHNLHHLLPLRDLNPKLRFSLYLHNDPRSMRGARTTKERLGLMADLDAVICCSHFVKDCWLDGMSAKQRKNFEPLIRIIPSGVVLPKAPLKKKKRIVFVGRLIEEKGVLPLIQAWQKILPKYPDWQAILVGAPKFGEADKKPAKGSYAEQCLKALGKLGDQATSLGFLSHDDVLDQFAQAEIACVPSIWEEPLGRVTIEAMAQGCAVISSGRGGQREILQGNHADTLPDDKLGGLITEPTTAKLATALENLIQDDDARAALQKRAQKQAKAYDKNALQKDMQKLRKQVSKS